MFVNMSIKMLILGPLTRSIICHYNLFLVGKQSMTGIILTFPGMQPPGNETKMSVHIDPTSMMGGARVSTLHCGAVNNLLSLWTVLCWLIMIPGRDPGGILLDTRNSSLLSTPFSTLLYHSPPPCRLDLPCSPWAHYSGLNPWQEKGARVTTLDTTASFSFGAT